MPTYVALYVLIKNTTTLSTSPAQITKTFHLQDLLNTSNSVISSFKDSLLDIHLLHPELGHTGETSWAHEQHPKPRIRPNSVAIGGGITSSKLNPKASKSEIVSKFPFFSIMLPSFCKTCSPSFTYNFYLAYDYVDDFYSNSQQLHLFSEVFHEQVRKHCPSNMSMGLHMVQCNHTKKPAWAQSDAMMEAYIDNNMYFYRINDDSQMITKGWTETFVWKLSQFTPSYLGVVGPKHQGGNMAILTYDFTHHTHVDMFGFHYPRDFPGRWHEGRALIVILVVILVNYTYAPLPQTSKS